MGIIHDLFKLTEEVKDSHGILAAEWFTEYCKLNKYQMKGILKDIASKSRQAHLSKNAYLQMAIKQAVERYACENLFIFAEIFISSRLISNFFATQGVSATFTIFFGSIDIFFAKYVLITGPCIPSGLLQVEIFFNISG